MHALLLEQMAIDYCTTPLEVAAPHHSFTVYRPLDGRRQFHENPSTPLKIAALGKKLLFTGNSDIIAACEKRFANENAAWFFEPEMLFQLQELLQTFECEITHLHPFYISSDSLPVDTQGLEIRLFHRDEIEQFRGDTRFSEAYSFSESAPDVLGAAAYENGQLLGMAGASADSPLLWQIGINVMSGAEGRGIGSMLTAILRNEILAAGRLPYYGTAFSHIVSQNVARKAGFVPAWCELTASPKSTAISK